MVSMKQNCLVHGHIGSLGISGCTRPADPSDFAKLHLPHPASELQFTTPTVELRNTHLAKNPDERHHLVTFDGHSPMVACCPST